MSFPFFFFPPTCSMCPLGCWVPPTLTQMSTHLLCCTFSTVVSGYKFLITAEGQLLRCCSFFRSHTSCLAFESHCQLTCTRQQRQEVAGCYDPDIFAPYIIQRQSFLCIYVFFTCECFPLRLFLSGFEMKRKNLLRNALVLLISNKPSCGRVAVKHAKI